MRVEPGGSLHGELTPPGDKSISHRYALLGAMAQGTTHIANYSPSDDCAAMLDCLRQLGVAAETTETTVELRSGGWRQWRQPAGTLDTRNSGTALRLLAGPLAGVSLHCRLAGDSSLNARPMSRIVTPLSEMGGRISADSGRPPLDIQGNRLRGIEYAPPQASAQVKSCVLLAGLVAEGSTTVVESRQTRDHTERALPFFGAAVESSGHRHTVSGPASLHSTKMTIPGDASAAVYFLLAGLLLPSSQLVLKGVGCNPTRSALLDLLRTAGARLRLRDPRDVNAEPVCDVEVKADQEFLAALPQEVPTELVPNLIDELPLLCVVAALSPNGLRLRSAGELRHKETDRIHALVVNLKQLGIDVEESADGLSLPGGQSLRGGRVTTFGDHRIAMAFAVAGLLSQDGVELDDPDCVAASHPNFFSDLESLRTDV